MRCPSCNHENREAAKFCEECAAPLKHACASCGAELRPSAKFCDECGTAQALPPPGIAAPAATDEAPADDLGARKVVTIVFADLVGSTALHERLDAESARALMDRYYRTLHAVVDEHGGTVVKLLGDGVMVAFGVPRVVEDDAIRAVRAAVGMQQAFRTLAEEQAAALGAIGLRVGVNTGEVVVSGAHDDVVGDPVNVAARLQQEAQDGDVLIGEATRRLVNDLVTLELFGTLTLKGRAEPVKAYRVVSLERPASATTAAFVGRADELARLTAVYDAAVATPAARLAVLLGSPGLGKSRLIAELTERLADAATVIAAHCDAAGGATFAPVARALREHLGIDDATSGQALRDTLAAAVPSADADHPRILDGVAALLAGSPAAPEETFFVVRRLLAALAAARPVVLVIDDLHWAEPLLLDLVEHFVQWGAGVRLLVVVGARPELRDTRASLTTAGGLVAEVVTLAGLDATAAMRLAANVIGAADLPAAVAAKVLATSEGNPLFVGELVRMLVHEGALQREGERWVVGAGLGALEMPPTIHALLAARIERLRPDERSVLERAAVVGRQFSRTAIAVLSGAREGADLDARLESLRRSELIEPDTGRFLGEPALRFHHVLIRDAAYRRLLKGTRAELHGRFADWIEGRAGDAVDHDEMIGWHLEQAYQHLRELGPLDAAGKRLGVRASVRLAAAGRRALARDDSALAANLLGRALAVLEGADPARADLALDWCEALLSAGDVGTAAGAIAELARFVADSDRLRAWHTCFAGQLTALTAPQALRDTADAVAAAADALATLGDAAGEAKAHAVHAQALARLGRVGGAEAALDRALAAARRAGDRRRANAVLAGAPLAALWGPSPVTRASGRCLDVVRVLRITQGAPAVEAVALSCQGVLEALRGRTEAARRMIASARKMVEELGISHRLFEADVFAARVDLLEGDAAAAERSLRGAYEGLRDLGLGIDAAQAAALLARAFLAQGRATEAEVLSHESEKLAGDDLQAAIAWRGVRAEALARRGEHVAAVEFAEAAVAIAATTDALLDHADARLALAAALRAAGRGREADAEDRRATELWAAKGASLLTERARRGDEAPRALPPEEQTAAAHPTRRRVRSTPALRQVERFSAAMAAADLAAASDLIAADVECIHHPTGASWDREALLTLNRQVTSARGLEIRTEYLATLGDALVLLREWSSWESLDDESLGPFGAVERERIILVEVDAVGCQRRVEFFAADHLGDAIARTYARHAELLPDGRAHARAVTTASAVGTLFCPQVDSYAAAAAPDIEFHDHRTLGFGSGRGADESVRLFDLAEGLIVRSLDVLRLASDALLASVSIVGTDRASGGAFELPFVFLVLFGPDGRIVRYESFDVEHEAEAIARFDVLTAAPEPTRAITRRVRPNTATATNERFFTAIANRDIEAFGREMSDGYEIVHHPTGATYGRRGMLATWRSLFRAKHLTYRGEMLATLDDSLVLHRHDLSSAGFLEERLASAGSVEMVEFVVSEVDEHGRFRNMELFAENRLREAVVCLYTRYAELLPEGPTRTRAEATARGVMTSMAFDPDPDTWTAGLAADVELIDHRTLGLPSGRGVEELVDRYRVLSELADDLALRILDVLRLEPSGLLMRGLMSGTGRASGGAFELHSLAIFMFGRDGLMTSYEIFDPDAEAAAHSRFDALCAAPTAPSARPIRRRLRPNAASALAARFEAAFAAGDADAVAAFWTDDLEVVDHPNGASYGRDGHLASIRRLQRAHAPKLTFEPLATLGDALCLTRRRVATQGTAGGRFDVGASEHEVLVLFEVDARGTGRQVEIFAAAHLADAVVRLYARFAELLPAGPAEARAAATARSGAAMLDVASSGRIEPFLPSLSPTAELVDHRLLGLPSARGREAVERSIRTFFELADVAMRIDDVLAVEPSAFVWRVTFTGTDRRTGGAFEQPALNLWAFDAGGFVTNYEAFDVDRVVDALARFDEIVTGTAVPSTPRFANAATRCFDAYARSWHARDWDGVLATLVPRLIDHRALTGLDLEGEDLVRNVRHMFGFSSSRWNVELLATRGERLALSRLCFAARGSDRDAGMSEVEFLDVYAIDAAGRPVVSVLFDPTALDAAYAELDARYDAGEAASHPRAAAAARAMALAWTSRDWEGLQALCAPSFAYHDHRLLGWGTLPDAAAWVRAQRALVDLAPDVRIRRDHVRMCDRGYLLQLMQQGTRDGGAFERAFAYVAELDDAGRFRRVDVYDVDAIEQARARFAEIAL